MKTCARCWSINEEEARVCVRCGSENLQTELIPPPTGGETEIIGTISRRLKADTRGRWHTELPLVMPHDTPTERGDLPLEIQGSFILQEADENHPGGFQTFDMDKGGVGGAAVLKVDETTVTLEQTTVMAGRFLQWSMASLLTMVAMVCVFEAGVLLLGTSGGHLPFTKVADRIMIGVALLCVSALLVLWALRISRRRTQTWTFDLDRVVNVHCVSFPRRPQQRHGVQFAVLPRGRKAGELGAGGASAQDCSHVTFATRDQKGAQDISHYLPDHFASFPVLDPQTRRRAELSVFARRLKAVTPKVWASKLIIGVNLGVYVLMGIMSPKAFVAASTDQVVRWGASRADLTLTGQWWRLLTNIFVHFGFFHCMLNMLAFWWVAKLTERLFGNFMFLAIYIGCGLAASANSLSAHPDIDLDPRGMFVTAGSAGAVIGIFGALLGYLAREGKGVMEGAKQPLTRCFATYLLGNFFFGATKNGIYSIIEALTNPQLIVAAGGGMDIPAACGGVFAGLIFGFMAARPIDPIEREAATRNSVLLLSASMIAVGFVFLTHLSSLAKQ